MNGDALSADVATARCAVPVVGIIGGIGSGKSTVARWIAEHHPVLVIDADQVGHRVLTDPAIIAALVREFGTAILKDDGQIDRRMLAKQVFGHTAAHQAARRQLEQIVHPAIRVAIELQLSQVNAAIYQAVLLDAAVLLEAGWSNICDAILYIDTAPELRLARVAEQRGWSAAELASREASQWPLDRKKQAADHILQNSGDIDQVGNTAWAVVQGLITHWT